MLRPARFEDLTETTGVPLSDEGASMMYTRYVYGRRLATGKRVLELACGSGQGLGLLQAGAQRLVGGDYSLQLLRVGRRHYGARVPLVQLSAEALPFRAESFDLVLFFEASYYVPHMDAAFDEIARVLGASGTVAFVNANPERPDFIRSPHSVHYHTADEFGQALGRRGFSVTIEAAFPVAPADTGIVRRIRSAALRLLRRALEVLHLVPRTLRGRARLKRLVFGRLRVVPSELPTDFSPEAERVAVDPGATGGWKVLYVTGTR